MSQYRSRYHLPHPPGGAGTTVTGGLLHGIDSVGRGWMMNVEEDPHTATDTVAGLAISSV
jgi:hypothetical protein